MLTVKRNNWGPPDGPRLHALLFAATAGLVCGAATITSAADITLSIDVSRVLGQVSPLLNTAFVEDINHAVVGGLHVELLADNQMSYGSFVGDDPERISVASIANPRFYLRFCGGQLMLTQDGTGDATFELVQPGLTFEDGTVSLRALTMPNTFSVYGTYLTAKPDGTLAESLPSNASSFAPSATFAVTSVPGGMQISSKVPELAGWLLTSSTAGDFGCEWLGTTIGASFQPAADTVQNASLWELAGPLMPSQAAWRLVNGTGVSVVGEYEQLGTSPPPPNAHLLRAIRVDFTRGSSGQPERLKGPSVGGTPRATGALPPHGAALRVLAAADALVCNVGYFAASIVLTAGEAYALDLWTYVGGAGEPISALVASLVSADGAVTYATADVPAGATGQWVHTAVPVFPNRSTPVGSGAQLCISPIFPPLQQPPAPSAGAISSVWLAFASLQPTAAAFRGRRNGMRADLAGLVAATRPAALRFPGGCFVEGWNSSSAFNFSAALGAVDARAGAPGFWGYWSHDFAGLFEYLLLAEDLGAAPVWVVHAGLFYGGGVDGDVQQYVDAALASVDFALGDAAGPSPWARQRAAMGHAAPFALRHVAIGNENGGSAAYAPHYRAIAAALRAAYPGLVLVANADLAGLTYDLWDFHIYAPDWRWFAAHQWDWDVYNRSAPPVFNSEYATKGGAGYGNLGAALGEAAWLTGLERNSDVVRMAAYAPLLVHARDRTWLPDAVTFNATHAFGSPSYWLQVLFGANSSPSSSSWLLGYNASATGAAAAPGPLGPFYHADAIASNAANVSLSVTLQASAGGATDRPGPAVATTAAAGLLLGAASGASVAAAAAAAAVAPPNCSAALCEVVLKAVSYCAEARSLAVVLTGLPAGTRLPPSTTLQSIVGSSLDQENSFEAPAEIAIVNHTVAVSPPLVVLLTLPPLSMHVLRLPLLA